jgi:hypothetical protein
VPTTTNTTTEAWGLCQPCRRWFYCGSTADSAVTAECPVCAAPAARLEVRLADLPE